MPLGSVESSDEFDDSALSQDCPQPFAMIAPSLPTTMVRPLIEEGPTFGPSAPVNAGPLGQQLRAQEFLRLDWVSSPCRLSS